ncbi:MULTISPECIES: flavin reductase family protein [unclassified Aureimonas]|uniref:flavin reductase family protein n=1 Tax=unclassified Aureimonas TaxID=2615206 RepID=UPI0006F80871|nr:MULTISPECIES: flavin reductase family protein [unclassified Aureimonas]KQT57531.1 flavin reductase [Aureimonas sp. Leaf427]KQT77212.1 flavin reductase [Aureimonas sp. Leaf460]
MFYTTDENRHGLPHDPFKAIVSPRPIGWISTRSKSGAVNLAPYSFFTAISDGPKLVMFSSVGMKDSASFAIESGEFVANLATGPLTHALNRSSAPAARGVSEFEIAGLTEAPCRLVAAPRVAESPAALECRVTEWFRPKALDGSDSENIVVIGQVVGIHLDERILKDGMIDVALAEPLSRLGYLDYAVTRDVFQLRRPREPDASDMPA